MVLVAEFADPSNTSSNSDSKVIGVGRLSKLRARNNDAEVAVLVSDAFQNQGLGFELLRRVIDVAREEKLTRVSSEMLGDNLAMRIISKKMGFRLSGELGSGSIRAVLDL